MSLIEVTPGSVASPVGGRAPGGRSGGHGSGPGRAQAQLVGLPMERVPQRRAGGGGAREKSAGRGKNAVVGSGQNRSVEPSLRARVRASDPDAFAALFTEHAQAVYRYAAGLSGSRSAAEEVVSLTFLEAWRLRQTVRPDGGSLRPWLIGIAVNVTRNQARAARRHRAAMSRLPPPPDLPDFADELSGRLDDRDRLAALRAAVRTLPPPERDVLVCVWSGLAPAEAAQALGVPDGTVRTRLARARRRLRAFTEAATPPGAVRQEKTS
jgi:RNA polymerase sigma factor (sigma-70 family)